MTSCLLPGESSSFQMVFTYKERICSYLISSIFIMFIYSVVGSWLSRLTRSSVFMYTRTAAGKIQEILREQVVTSRNKTQIQSGPSCSKHRWLNELVKRSTC